MEISKSDNGGKVLLSISGEIDLDASPNLRKDIVENLNNSKSVDIDLSAVTYIDSSGVSCLIEGTQLAAKNNLNFIITALSNEVMQVLQLAHLDKILKIQS